MAKKLKLDRSLGNPAFEGWKLDPDSTLQQSSHQLHGRAHAPLLGGTGFLQTKMVVTYNHLHQLNSGIYTFLVDTKSNYPSIYRLEYVDGGAHGIATYLVAGPLTPIIEGDFTTPEAKLPSSVTEVVGGSPGDPVLLVASSGKGDLWLIPSNPQSSSTAAITNVNPLRQPSPMLGIRPFIVESAYRTSDCIRCIVSAVRQRSAAAPAACEVFVISLKCGISETRTDGTTATDAHSPPNVAVTDVQLLQTSVARPHAVVTAPALDRVLVALDPSTAHTTSTSTPKLSAVEITGQDCNICLADRLRDAMASTPGTSAAAAAAFHSHFTAALDPAVALSSNVLPDCTNPGPLGDCAMPMNAAIHGASPVSPTATAAAAPQPPMSPLGALGSSDTFKHDEAATPSNSMTSLEGSQPQQTTEQFDGNPLNFEQAVRNLDRFTSDQPAGDLLPEHMAEIDNDTPEDEAALEALPHVALLLFAPANEYKGGVADGGAFEQVDSLDCGVHKLLGPSPASAPAGGTAADGTASLGVLLGLTDDVDVAVMRVSIAADGSLAATHECTVPALAYVAAGKVQKRSVLFAPSTDANIAAAIVEAHAYAFLYRKVPLGHTAGANAILPLGLSRESLGVLGAVLVAGLTGLTLLVMTEDSLHTFCWT